MEVWTSVLVSFCVQEAVKNINVSGNFDEPEGAFDALMQAIVCKKVEYV